MAKLPKRPTNRQAANAAREYTPQQYLDAQDAALLTLLSDGRRDLTALINSGPTPELAHSMQTRIPDAYTPAYTRARAKAAARREQNGGTGENVEDILAFEEWTAGAMVELITRGIRTLTDRAESAFIDLYNDYPDEMATALDRIAKHTIAQARAALSASAPKKGLDEIRAVIEDVEAEGYTGALDLSALRLPRSLMPAIPAFAPEHLAARIRAISGPIARIVDHHAPGRAEQIITDNVLLRWEIDEPPEPMPIQAPKPAETLVHPTAQMARQLIPASRQPDTPITFDTGVGRTKTRPGAISGITITGPLMRPLAVFDKAVLFAVHSIWQTDEPQALIPGCPPGIVFTPLSILRTLTYPGIKAPADRKILTDIEDSLDVLGTTRGIMNVADEMRRRGKSNIDHYTHMSYLLPYDTWDEVTIGGARTRVYQTRGIPLICLYWADTNQQTAIDPAVRAIQKTTEDGRLMFDRNGRPKLEPISKERILIRMYLEERVAIYRRALRTGEIDDKGKERLNKVLASTLIDESGLERNTHLQRNLDFAVRVLRHWRAIDYISAYGVERTAYGNSGRKQLASLTFECDSDKYLV